MTNSRGCESAHSIRGLQILYLTRFWRRSPEERTIKNDDAFDDCVILSKDSFDPDAVFLDDIVDDEVLPYLSLAVDGLTSGAEGRKGRLELRPDDVAANEELRPDTTLVGVKFDPEQLEVYGWESSWFRKLRGYFGL